MAPQTQVRRIEVRIDTNGDKSLQNIANGFSKMHKQMKESTYAIDKFRNAFLAIQGLSFAGIGIGQLVDALDSMQKLNDKLVIFTGSTENAKSALADLNSIAKDNKSSIEDTAVIYQRMVQALGDTGISTKAVLGLTDTLQKTFRLSGTTAAEATASIIQLSQGLASGQVRGQELRSVLEQNVVIGDLLAKQFKVTRGELLKLSEKQGGFKAAEVIQALANASGDLNEKLGKLAPTISESFSTNINALKLKIDELNKSFGISEKVISAMDFVFKNLDIIGSVVLFTGAIKGLGLAIKLAGEAQLFFNTQMLIFSGGIAKIVASPFVGFLVKTAVVLGGLKLALIAIAVALTGWLVTLEPVQNALSKIYNGIKDIFQAGYYENQEKIAKATAKAAKESYVFANSTQKLAFDQSTLGKAFGDTIKEMETGKGQLSEFQRALNKYAYDAKDSQKVTFDFKAELAKLNEQFLKDGNLIAYNKSLKDIQIKDLNQDFKAGVFAQAEYAKKMKEILEGKKKSNQNTLDMREDLKQLNDAYYDGTVSLGQYASALDKVKMDKLKKDVKDGRSSVLDLNEAMYTGNIEMWRRQLAEGTMTLEYFNETASDSAIMQLNKEFQTGKIDIYQYNQELVKTSEMFQPNSALFVGTQNYIQSAGTLSQNVAGLVTNTFGHLEDTMVEFTKTGTFEFRKMTLAILEDLNRIIIRSLIIRPLAQGILNGIGGAGGSDVRGSSASDYGASSGFSQQAAHGAAFDGGRANFFATGGVVSNPTMFKYGGNKTGIMGEAGPEAILPLKRNSNGDLGVSGGGSNVTVNIINQSGSQVEQNETTDSQGNKTIEVLIMGTVKEGFAKGSFDKQMSSQYGLRRRGV